MGKRKVKRCNEKVTRNKKHINAKVVRLEKTIKKKKKKVERCYSVDQVQEALHEIGEGMSLRIAAETFGVSRSTLHRKLYSQSAIDCRKGPRTILSAEEEKTLVEWIIYCAERGFPVTKTHLLNCIQKFLIDYKKKTAFKDNRPGNYWYRAFMRRHNNLSQRIAQNLTTTRASVTEEDLREWFSHIKNYLEKKNLLSIEPHRIFNLEESAFMLVPKDNCVIAEKGSKSVYQITGNDKACQLREEKRKRKN